jgi:hypothetical protein
LDQKGIPYIFGMTAGHSVPDFGVLLDGLGWYWRDARRRA